MPLDYKKDARVYDNKLIFRCLECPQYRVNINNKKFVDCLQGQANTRPEYTISKWCFLPKADKGIELGEFILPQGRD